MSEGIFSAWDRGGKQYEYMAYKPSINTSALYVQSNGVVKQVEMDANQLDLVAFKFNFFMGAGKPESYFFNVIQRDANGKIIGGETIMVEVPYAKVNEEFGEGEIVIEPGKGFFSSREVNSEFDDKNWIYQVFDIENHLISRFASMDDLRNYCKSVNSSYFNIVAVSENGKLRRINISDIIDEPINNIVVSSDSLQIYFNSYCVNEGDIVSIKSLSNYGFNSKEISLTSNQKDYEISTQSFPRGIYVVSYLTNDGYKQTKKIML